MLKISSTFQTGLILEMPPTAHSMRVEEEVALLHDFLSYYLNSFDMNRLICALIIFLVGNTHSLQAQVLNFSGGTGDGSSSRATSTIQLNGVLVELSFSGGIGQGSASFSIPVSKLNGFGDAQSFFGGVGDGAAIIQSQILTLSGVPTQYPTEEISFTGGIADGGFQSQSAATFLNGSSITINFSGGNGMGYSTSKSPFLLVSGTPFEFVFAGGNGRGDQIRKSPKYTLNGVLAGSFVRIAQSGVHDFQARPEPKHTRLNWKTDRPENVDHFVVQHSRDGLDFNQVGFVSADRPQSSTYQFLSPANATLENSQYFRIQQVFKDSSFSISDVLRLDGTSANQWTNLFPNPASESLQLDFDGGFEVRTWRITDITGQVVKEGTELKSPRQLQIQVAHLPTGLYHLDIQGNTESRKLRFSKN